MKKETNGMIDIRIKELSDIIARKSAIEAECFPVDRYFLKPYLEEILKLDRDEFLLYNIEKVNTTYTVQLFLCLPELWEGMSIDALLSLISRFTNIFSYYGIIFFTYKYVEINIIELILDLETISNEIKKNILDYLKSQYPNFLKTETDLFFFNEGIYGVDIHEWTYIKQNFLLDTKVSPALQTIEDLEKYIKSLVY